MRDARVNTAERDNLQRKADQIGAQIQGATPIVYSGTLERAVHQAFDAAASGDVVLLAPACASFDHFENYEQRGRVFKELVAAIAAKSNQPVTLGGRG